MVIANSFTLESVYACVCLCVYTHMHAHHGAPLKEMGQRKDGGWENLSLVSIGLLLVLVKVEYTPRILQLVNFIGNITNASR